MAQVLLSTFPLIIINHIKESGRSLSTASYVIPLYKTLVIQEKQAGQ
jgi:hypothetical protein